MSSIKPNDAGGQLNRGQEVPYCFVIASCYPSKLLEPGEEVLNQMARRVHVSIEWSRLLAIGFRRDHRGLSGGGEWLDNPLIGIERLIGEQHVRPYVRQKFVRANQVMGLSAGQMDGHVRGHDPWKARAPR